MPGINDWLKKAYSDLKASKKLSDDYETSAEKIFMTIKSKLIKSA